MSKPNQKYFMQIEFKNLNCFHDAIDTPIENINEGDEFVLVAGKTYVSKEGTNIEFRLKKRTPDSQAKR